MISNKTDLTMIEINNNNINNSIINIKLLLKTIMLTTETEALLLPAKIKMRRIFQSTNNINNNNINNNITTTINIIKGMKTNKIKMNTTLNNKKKDTITNKMKMKRSIRVKRIKSKDKVIKNH